jgi:prepilin-type N-terminal cleavage/methylation domain-containing protein
MRTLGTPSSGRARSRAGFSFVEILVVMGIIAVLVGLGIGVYMLAIKQSEKSKSAALLNKVRTSIDLWKGRYKAYPPSEFQKLSMVLGPTLKLGRPVPSNANNPGIEALVQALYTPGFGQNPDLDNDKCNTDEDALDKAFAVNGDLKLWEIQDPWGHPLVYFTDADYKDADKNPPTYVDGAGAAFNPKPWRTSTGTFAQANGFQLFSIGADGQPNTDDDVKAWE